MNKEPSREAMMQVHGDQLMNALRSGQNTLIDTPAWTRHKSSSPASEVLAECVQDKAEFAATLVSLLGMVCKGQFDIARAVALRFTADAGDHHACQQDVVDPDYVASLVSRSTTSFAAQKQALAELDKACGVKS